MSKLKLLLPAFAFALLSLSPSSKVFAAQGSVVNLSIPVSTVIFDGAFNGKYEVAQADIDAAHQGMQCAVSARAENQGSVHLGNNLIIASGDTSVTLEDVEREANVVTTATGSLTLGEEVTVTLHMTQDVVFSAGMDVELTCEQPEEETIEVCRDDEIITIPASERQESDTDTCPVEGQTTVCRDDQIVTVNESEVKDTDIVANECPGEVLPAILPVTGAASNLSVFASILGLGAIAQFAYAKKQS